MGSMLLQASHRFSPGRYRLHAAGRRPSLDRLGEAIAGLRTGSARDVAAACEMVVLAVQPSRYPALVEEIAPNLKPGAIVVSITNGVPLDAIAERVRAPLVKVIPTVAHAVGRGISLVMPGPRATATHVRAVTDFLSPFGKPVVIPAEDARVATNITGCGPALLSLFVTTLVRANGKRATRIDDGALRALMQETLSATAAMIDTGISPDRIIHDAATGGGMTQAALDALSLRLPELADAMVEQTFARERLLAGNSIEPEGKGNTE